MSINALANAAATRRNDIFPLNEVPKGLGEIARAAATPPSAEPPATAESDSPERPGQIETALHVLFGYIPTEVLTLYVAVLAAIETTERTSPGQWRAFYVFLVATPLVVWLIYGAKVKAAGKPLPLSFRTWPLWEMSAAMIAYCAWAFALPDSPFADYGRYSEALSGVAVLVASTLLGLLAPFFQRPLRVDLSEAGKAGS